MFYNDIRRLEKRLKKLEQERRQEKKEDGGIKIILDFNRDGEDDPDKKYLIATIPPKSQWKWKVR